MFPCLNKLFFGLDCPGCGFQRAFIELISGNFINAWQLYPPIFSMLLSLVIAIVLKQQKKVLSVNIFYLLTITNASLVLINYVYKMKFLF